MNLNKRVNYKRYIPMSLIVTAFFCAFAENYQELTGILIVYVATVINQFLLVKGVREMIRPHIDAGAEAKNGTIFFIFMLKLGVIFGGLALGVHFMDSRVIIALLNYVVQIFVLGVNLDKKV